MKKQLLSIVLTLTPLLATLSSTAPVEACSLSAGDYNLPACITPSKKKTTTEFVRVYNKTTSDLWIKNNFGQLKQIRPEQSAYIKVKFIGNVSQPLRFAHSKTNYRYVPVDTYRPGSEAMRRDKYLTFYGKNGVWSHHWSYSAYERR